MPEEVLHRHLAHLQTAEFLYETRLFPEREYTFKHALTHEVAYSGLLQERRRLLHARIVEVLEQHHTDRLAEQVERLAHHALRGEVWDKAMTYCQQAGARAQRPRRHSARQWPLRAGPEALAHLPEHPDTGGWLSISASTLAGALSSLGEYTSDASPLRRGRGPGSGSSTIKARLGKVLDWMAVVLLAPGDLDGAMAAGQRDP